MTTSRETVREICKKFGASYVESLITELEAHYAQREAAQDETMQKLVLRIINLETEKDVEQARVTALLLENVVDMKLTYGKENHTFEYDGRYLAEKLYAPTPAKAATSASPPKAETAAAKPVHCGCCEKYFNQTECACKKTAVQKPTFEEWCDKNVDRWNHTYSSYLTWYRTSAHDSPYHNVPDDVFDVMCNNSKAISYIGYHLRSTAHAALKAALLKLGKIRE